MDMKLKDLLEKKKSTILQRWFEAIMATYPADTSGFLKKQKDMFLIQWGIRSLRE
ncbi:RsbRD N-terminal domain-containing protein [Desulfosporosinus nitroreducens]|uniref:RsbRD N-terminal domain-containing protein n=1 Tax=Desulfosporosinus nitroreducens TaxID=2018668 RepID=UPI0028524D00|nr:RsbRD N-terminal domain-containing protein [Desulfosporosinus nitroreducens]